METPTPTTPPRPPTRTQARPGLLLLSPVIPDETGYGLAMRAGVFLEAFAQDHEVTLLVVPVFGAENPAEKRFALAHARRLAIADLAPGLDPLFALSARVRDARERSAALVAYPRPQLCRFATRATLRQLQALASPPGGEPFDAVVVLRSYLAPYAEPFLAAPRRVLDLDDDEQESRLRLAGLHERHGRAERAAEEAAEAAKYARLEEEWLPRFDWALTCSDEHRARLLERLPAVPCVGVPNSVRLPPAPRATHARDPAPEARLLFVGNLSYEPNVDAAQFLCDEILPRLEDTQALSWRLRLVGARPRLAVRRLAERARVELVADPPTLAEHYAWATAAVVPLLAGGGTRIKLLEAFAAGVPVVSTRIGAEGIAADDDVHLLLADTPAAFAGALQRLAREPEIGTRLARNAFQRVRERYAPEAVVGQIRDLVRQPGPPDPCDKLRGS